MRELLGNSPISAFGRGFLLLLFAFAAVGANAQDRLLDEARAELAAGNAAGAYAMLEPAEIDRAGEPAFDYLLGVAALDAGRPTNAVFALERVVSLQPDNALARAELARAYARLREFESARQELEAVRAGEVPAEARSQVERYLGAVETAISQANTQIRGFLAVGTGYDSNVNASTSDSLIALPLFGGALVTLNNNAVSASDQFFTVAGGASVRHVIRPDLSVNGGLNVNARIIDDRDQFGTDSFSGFAGVDYLRNDYTYSLALQGEHFRLNDAGFRNAYGVLGQVRRPLGQTAQVTAYVQATRLDYVSQPIRDADRYTLGAAFSKALDQQYSPVFFVGVYGGIEDERRSGVAHLGHDFLGARAGMTLEATHDLNLSLTGSIERRDYGGNDPLFLVSRDDTRYGLRFAADYQPDTLWTFTPAVELTRNDSNVAINDYDRHVVSFTVRRDFR